LEGWSALQRIGLVMGFVGTSARVMKTKLLKITLMAALAFLAQGTSQADAIEVHVAFADGAG